MIAIYISYSITTLRNGHTHLLGHLVVFICEQVMDEDSRWAAKTLLIWEQNLGQDNEWQFSKFSIPDHITRTGYKIQFTAEGNGPGFIAIDDLSLTDSSC